MLGTPDSSFFAVFFDRAPIPRPRAAEWFTMADWARPTQMLPLPRLTLWRLTAAVEGGLLVAAIVLGYFAEEPFWTRASARPLALLAGCISGLVLLGLAIAAVNAPIRLLEGIRRDIDRIMVLFHKATLFDLFCVSLLAGVGEEALFRGVLQPFAADYAGVPAALVLVSLAFGLMHCISVVYVAFAGTLGMAFGMMYVMTDNILVPMIAHAVYDIFALVYGMRVWTHRGNVL